MASKVAIWNMALGRIGVSETIASPEERSVAAIQCRTFYDQNVEFVLRAFDWPFATGYHTLGLVAEEPTDDWLYAYRYPVSALKVRRVVTALGRRDPTPPPFVIGQDTQGALIYTDQEDVIVETTETITDSSRFDPLFTEALSWKQAADIAPALSRMKGAQEAALKMFGVVIYQAQVIVANEQQREPELDSEFVRARG